MDKLKYIKIENEDGSLSDNIPLGVDAENVDVTSADNSQNLADYISVNDGKINSINSQIDDLQDSDTSLSNQIKSLSSGSPKGSYATVNALKSANPETGVYVITSNGHIYSWTKNSSEAIDLGVYQAMELEDNSVGYDKLNLVHNNPVYLKDSLKFKKSTMHLFVPDLFVYINNRWKTIKATDFPADYPTGEFRFWIHDLTTIYYDTEKASKNQNPLICKTLGSSLTQVGDRYRTIAVVRDNHVLSEYTVKYMEDEDIVELKNKIDNIESEFDINKCKLMIPDKLFVIDTVNFPLYKNSMVSDFDEAKKCLMEFKSEKGYADAYYEYIEPKLNVDTSKIGSDCFIGVIPNKLKWEKGVYGKNVTIVSKSLSNVTNKTPKLLFFGDSLTVKGTPTKTKEYLTSWGINATLQGSVKDDYNSNCEGRGNRTFAQYIGYRSLETTDDITPTPIYPFLKVATSEDKTNHPEWCFTRTGSVHEQNYNEATDKTQTFYIFDFAYYLSSKDYSNPDVVIISMSTNDFWKYNANEATNICKLAYDIMINQILTACPNCKIGIIPNPSYANTRGDKNVVAEWNATAQDYIRNMNKSNVDVIGTWMSQNTDMAFVFAKVNKVSNGDIYNYRQQDTIHPSVWGIKETSKIIAAYIVNQL